MKKARAANHSDSMDFTSISQLLKVGSPWAALAAVAITWLRYWYKLRAPGAYVDAINRAHGKGQCDAVVKLFCAANPAPKERGHRVSRVKDRTNPKSTAGQAKNRERNP